MPAIVSRPWDAKVREFEELLTRLADLASNRYVRDIYQRLYVAAKRAAGADSLNPSLMIWDATGMTVATDNEIDDRDDVFAVFGEAIPRHMTRDGLRDWLRERLRREPLSIFAD